MVGLPNLTPPGSLGGTQSAAPAQGAATPPIGTAQSASLPLTPDLDPTTQNLLLQQAQRSGWNAAPPQPDVKYVSNGYGQMIPVVQGYKMVITNPQNGARETLDLNYNSAAQGKGAQWGLAGAPDVKAPTASTTVPHIGDEKTGYYTQSGPPDANGNKTWQMVVPPGVPNADDEMKKALDRIDRQQEMAEKQANEAAGRGYMTNADYATMASKDAGDKLGQDKLAEDIRQFNATQAQKDKKFDRQQDAKDKVDAQNILQSQAQVGQINAQTGQIATATDIAKQKVGPEIAEIQARTDLSTQQKAELVQKIQQANQPTTVQATLGTTYGQYAQVDPNTGKVSFVDNPNYTPVTQAQVAARVGQLHNLMLQKGQEVQGKVGQFVDGKQYTAEDALRDFNTWHDQNIAPQQASLQAAQDDALLARAKDEASMRQQAYTAALGAGNQQVNAINARTNMNPVGAGYADVMDMVRQGKMPTGEQMKSAFTYQAQDPTQVAQQATQNAYQQMLGSAASNAPNPQAIDIAAQLNRTNYGGPPGAPAPAGPGAPAAPGQTAGANFIPGWPGSDPQLSGVRNPEPNAPRPLPSQFANPIYTGLAQGTSAPGPQMPPQMPFGAIAANPWANAPNYSFGG